jgi:hypothetical protein
LAGLASIVGSIGLRRINDGLVFAVSAGNGRLCACRRSGLCRIGHVGSFYERLSGVVIVEVGMKQPETRFGFAFSKGLRSLVDFSAE